MRKKLFIFLLAVLVFVVCYPVVFLLAGSFMGQDELAENLKSVLLQQTGEYTGWSILPMHPTLHSYIEVLLDEPEFFAMFWNSIKIAVGVLAGQMLVGIPAAWGFAKYRFPLRRTLFAIYIIFMMLPFQVVMLSEYLVLNEMKLIDTLWAVILPGAFSTFPVFIVYNFFRGIPDAVLEAARLDGISEGKIFLYIGIPMGLPGIVSAMILQFLEFWNLIEQPLTFFKSKPLWPLSLYLPNISLENAGLALAASVIALIPSMLVFFAGQNHLEQGIAATAVKE